MSYWHSHRRHKQKNRDNFATGTCETVRLMAHRNAMLHIPHSIQWAGLVLSTGAPVGRRVVTPFSGNQPGPVNTNAS